MSIQSIKEITDCPIIAVNNDRIVYESEKENKIPEYLLQAPIEKINIRDGTLILNVYIDSLILPDDYEV